MSIAGAPIPSREDGSRSIPTSSKILPGGCLIELVRRGDEYQLSHIVPTSDSGVEISDSGAKLHIGEDVFVPLSSSELDEMLLPATLEANSDLDETFEGLTNCLADNLQLEPDHVLLSAHFIILTWIADLLAHSPVLACWGRYSPHRDNFETLLRILCRRSLVFSQLSALEFKRLPFDLQPTLILSQPNVSAQLEAVLGASRRNNQCITLNGQPRNIRCAVAILSENPISDVRLQFNCVEVSVLPKRVSALQENVVNDIANHFQPRLLAIRARMAGRSRAQKEFGDLQIYAGFPMLQARVNKVLNLANKAIDDELGLSIESLVVEALYSHCKEFEKRGPARVHVGEINKTVKAICLVRHTKDESTDRKIGSVLRKLSLPVRRLGSRGFGLSINPALIDRIHILSKIYDIPLPRRKEKLDNATTRVAGSRSKVTQKESYD